MSVIKSTVYLTEKKKPKFTRTLSPSGNELSNTTVTNRFICIKSIDSNAEKIDNNADSLQPVVSFYSL